MATSTKNKELWTDSVGGYGSTVWVGEREGKPGVYARYKLNGSRTWHPLEVTIRDAKKRILKGQTDKAKALALEIHQQLEAGNDPKKPKGQAPLTLREGVNKVFSIEGLFPTADANSRDARRQLNDAITLLGGDNVTWETLTPGSIRKIWRTLAQNSNSGEGHNKAYKTVQTFFRVAKWLQSEYPDVRFPHQIPSWGIELKKDWEKITNKEITVQRPRHSPEEARAILEHLNQADPRISLALSLGAELRGGQVVRTMRSFCDLSDGAGAGFGTVEVKGRGKKKGATLHLNRGEREILDAAMKVGFLASLESAFQRGRLTDYPLFPAGKMDKTRVVKVRDDIKPMHRRTILSMFHETEKLAGVTPQEGRGWHGLRRAFSDIYEAEAVDARVKDAVGGWAPGSEMRRAIYQNQENQEVFSVVSSLREKVRGTLKDQTVHKSVSESSEV